jgi:hypothetical protein
MPSLAGHILSGLIMSSVTTGTSKTLNIKRLSVAAVIVAAPDRYMLLILLGSYYISVDRTFTHSQVTVFVMFHVMREYDHVLAARHSRYRIPYILISFCLISHITLDHLSEDLHGPTGMMVFWPLSTSFFHPDLNVFLTPLSIKGSVLPLKELILVGLRELTIINLMGLFILFVTSLIRRNPINT